MKIFKRLSAALFMTALLLLPVSAADADTNVYGAVTTRHTGFLVIEVKDAADQTPISGAQVTLLSQTGKEIGLVGVTDTAGKISPNYELAPGTYSLRAEKSGYKTGNANVEMTPALEINVTILMSSRNGGGGSGGGGSGSGGNGGGKGNPAGWNLPSPGDENGDAAADPTGTGNNAEGLPRTGGSWDMLTYGVLLLLNSVILLVMLFWYRRKKRKAEL